MPNKLKSDFSAYYYPDDINCMVYIGYRKLLIHAYETCPLQKLMCISCTKTKGYAVNIVTCVKHDDPVHAGKRVLWTL
jgi:hypothetical protein